MKYFSTHTLKSIFIILFSFFIFFAISKSNQNSVVYIPYTGDTDSFIKQLYEQGLIPNTFARTIIQFLLTCTEIEPGHYAFSKGMGAVSTAVSLDEPEYKYVSIQEGYRKGQIAQLIGERLNWEEEKVRVLGTVEPVCPLNGQEGYLASGTYLIHK